MSRSTFLPFSLPVVGEEELAELADTLKSGWLSTAGKTRAFEAAMVGLLKAPGALALNSCTAALHTALVTAEVGAGAEVITTPMTFAASANVVEHVGARPVFVDVEPDTLNLDPARLEAALTPRTRAIIVVHYTGHPVDMDPVRAFAAQHRLLVIEDAAHALPTQYKGRFIGESDNPVAFSFYATKNLTTGEGGMLTASPEFLERARVVALHGMSRAAWERYKQGGSWRYEIVLPGFKYNMSDLAASLGLRQLERLPGFQKRRKQIAATYNEAFGKSGVFETPVEKPYATHGWHLYVLRLHPEQLTIGRDRFIDELTKRNIGTSVHFIPLHLQPFYRNKYGYQPSDFPVAAGAFERMLSLPLDPRLTDADVGDVIEAVHDVAAAFRR